MTDNLLVQWENGVMSIPLTADFSMTLNKAGEDGWEAWAVLGGDEENVRVAVKRHKRLISMSTDIMGALKQ